MKKYLVVVMGVLFVLSFAASAFAIHAEIPSETQAVVAKGTTQVNIGGDIRFRGAIRNNTSDFNSDKSDHAAYYDTRVRLSVEAKVSPNTIGKIHLESGTTDNNDIDIWGAGTAIGPNGQTISTSDAKGTYRNGNSKIGDVTILEAWIQHSGSGLLGIPAYAKVGHMPITVGKGLFLDHSKYGDDAILLGGSPMKGMEITLAAVKARESNVNLSDDADVYALLFNYAFDKNGAIGADVSYLNDQQFPQGLAPSDLAAHFWNVGVNGNYDFGILVLRGDFAVQFGELQNDGGDSPNFEGWAGVVGVDFKLGDVKLVFEGAYGSGQKLTDDDVKTFVTSQSNVQHYTFVYDYLTVNAANNPQGGLQNTWYLKLGGSYDISKEFNILANAYYLQSVKKIDSATVGGVTVNNYGFAHSSNSHNIGFEVDAKATWKIDRNLTWWVEGGYLFAGNFWKAVAGQSPDDAYAVRHGIQLSF